MHLPGIGNIERLGASFDDLSAEEQSIQMAAMYPNISQTTLENVVSADRLQKYEVEHENPKAPFPWLLVLAGGAGVLLLLRRPSNRFGRR